MTDHRSDTATRIADEPAPESGAGSRESQAPASPMRDVLRVLVCAMLVAGCVSSPAVALFVAPFVPVIVALRLLRRSSGDPLAAMRSRRSFLVSASAAAVVAAVLSTPADDVVAPALFGALALVPMLGLVHAHAARRDPVHAATADPDPWPEPRAWSGLTPTIHAWALATCIVVAAALAATGTTTTQLTDRGTELVDDTYATYTDSCDDGGALESQQELCDRLDEQRAQVQEVIDDHAPALLGALAAVFAFGAAATAHLVVLGRARAHGIRIRPRYRLAQLELHWSWAYVAALGIVGWLIASGDDPVVVWLRAVFGATAVLGVLAIIAQGAGMLAHVVAGARRPGLLTAAIVFFLLVASPVAAISLLVLGMLDMSLHPRRRAAEPPAA